MNHGIFLCQSQIVPSLEVVDQEAHDLGLWSSQVIINTFIFSVSFFTISVGNPRKRNFKWLDLWSVDAGKVEPALKHPQNAGNRGHDQGKANCHLEIVLEALVNSLFSAFGPVSQRSTAIFIFQVVFVYIRMTSFSILDILLRKVKSCRLLIMQ